MGETEEIQIKKFIAVVGKTKTGKTSIIFRCFELVSEKKPEPILKGFKYCKQCGDFVALLEWQGKHLGFISGGYNTSECKTNCRKIKEWLKGKSLDICIFAVRETKEGENNERYKFWRGVAKANGKEDFDEIVKLDSRPIDNINKNIEKIGFSFDDKSEELLEFLKKILEIKIPK